MTKLKDKMIYAMVDAQNTVAMELKNPTKGTKIFGISAIAATVFSLSIAPLFAASDLFSNIGSALKSVYGAFVGISAGIACVALVIAFLWGMVSTNPQKAMIRRDWIKRILISLFAINVVGALIAWVPEIAGSSGVGEMAEKSGTSFSGN